MTISIHSRLNDYGEGYMIAEGDSANDVFVATAEYGVKVSDWGTIYFGELDWEIDGGAGNDKLTAGDEDDTVTGGLGNDTIWGLDGEDRLFGNEGNDQLFGGAMNDYLDGGANDDWLAGDDGNDTLEGGFGNDTMVGGTGADLMRGWDGNDTYYVDNAGDIVQETGWADGLGGWVRDSTGVDTVFVALGSYTLPSLIENGGVQSGYGAGVRLVGNGLSNNLTGGAGVDTLDGGAGNDTIDGYGGNDVMRGGLDNDTYVVTESGDQVIELAGEGTDSVQLYLTGYTLPANVENAQLFASANANVTGNALANKLVGNLYANTMYGMDGNDSIDGFLGNDVLVGGNGNDTLEGNFGNDQLYGNAGNDSLSGSAGTDIARGGDGNDIARGGNDNDTLYGEAGNDQLFGDAGNDLLLGGAGKDTMSGGTGYDTFKFNATSDSIPASFDIVQGFVQGQDKIDLSTIDANIGMTGDQAFAFTATKPFFTSAGDLWTNAITGGVSVYLDVGGDGIADMRIDVMGVTSLAASDFVL